METAKVTYLSGLRVHLLKMDDAQAPAVGTEGTVIGVDDIGSVMVAWDNGSSLCVLLGVNYVEIIGEEGGDDSTGSERTDE